MKLDQQGLTNQELWENAGYVLPKFDRAEMIKKTTEEPTWVHFGAGNIFRAFPAMLQQKLLDSGLEDKGIIVVEGYDYEIIDQMAPFDNLSLLVTLKADGSTEKTVVASLAEALQADSENQEAFSRLREIFRAPSLQMVSFTITEKGYSLVQPNGEFMADVVADFEAGPEKPKSYIGKLASLCYERYQNGKLSLALVSMDNCSHNGTKLFEAVQAFAAKWEANGKVEKGFLGYVENPSKLSFPWSMIDKITPRPDEGVKEMLLKDGFENAEGNVTSKNTYIAPFVNAEEAEYLVIEDLFPAGRPALDKVGVIFTTRETVDKVEKMKVCTCLNPLHTALAIYGCLLGYTKISDEMKDSELLKLVEVVGYQEGLPVVVDPGILSPRRFIDEVLQVRFPNPFMPDTPQRIATDTSQKIPIRFGETIKAYAVSETLEVRDLKIIPLVLAGWLRYLLGVDDKGESMAVSPDPMLGELQEKLSGIKLGETAFDSQLLNPILSNEKFFGVDLYSVGLAELVESYLREILKGPGAVRETLKKYL